MSADLVCKWCGSPKGVAWHTRAQCIACPLYVPLCEVGKRSCACGELRVGDDEAVYNATGAHRRLWCSPVRIEGEWVESPDEWYAAEVLRMSERAPA